MTLHIHSTDSSLKIQRDGVTALVHNAAPGGRPYLHPLLASDGDGTLTEDAPPHHAWQHGLYFGLNDVNDVGFWTEGKFPKHTNDGSWRNLPITDAHADGDNASWTSRTQWLAPDGTLMISDVTRWRLDVSRPQHVIDLAWSLTAEIDLRFGKYEYGGLFLRMPCVSTTPVQLLTSEGVTVRTDADAHRARWVALSMPLPDRKSSVPAGCAVMEHPENPEYPAPWRVDWEYGIGPARCAAGEWHLSRGQTVTFRHRVVLFTGSPGAGMLNRLHEEFSSTRK
jgi:hypothetical protein